MEKKFHHIVIGVAISALFILGVAATIPTPIWHGSFIGDISQATNATWAQPASANLSNAASGSVNGYLSSSDWSVFNGKQAALGFTPLTAVQTTNAATGEALKTTNGLGSAAFFASAAFQAALGFTPLTPAVSTNAATGEALKATNGLASSAFGNASGLSSGTVADARLTGNVALYSAPNFTNAMVYGLSATNDGNRTVGPGGTNFFEGRNTNSASIAPVFGAGTNGNFYIGKSLLVTSSSYFGGTLYGCNGIGGDTSRSYLDLVSGCSATLGSFGGSIAVNNSSLTYSVGGGTKMSVSSSADISVIRNVTASGAATFTNGIILPQLAVIPTNSMPLCSSTVTNWTLLNLQAGSGGNNVYLVATNVAAGGWLYSKLTGTITATP